MAETANPPWYYDLPSLQFSSVYAGRLAFKLSGRWGATSGGDWGRLGTFEIVLQMQAGPSGGPYTKSGVINPLCGYAELELDYPGGGVIYVASVQMVSRTAPSSGAYVGIGFENVKITAKLTKK